MSAGYCTQLATESSKMRAATDLSLSQHERRHMITEMAGHKISTALSVAARMRTDGNPMRAREGRLCR